MMPITETEEGFTLTYDGDLSFIEVDYNPWCKLHPEETKSFFQIHPNGVYRRRCAQCHRNRLAVNEAALNRPVRLSESD